MASKRNPPPRRQSIGNGDVLWIVVPLLLFAVGLCILGYMFFLAHNTHNSADAKPGPVTDVSPKTKTP
jgi:hypothetical protein